VLPADGGPDAKHQTLSLVRKKVSIEEQAAKKQIIEVKDGATTRRVGVIQLPTFYLDFDARRRGDRDYKSATRDTAKLLAELKQEKVDGVVIDLRNNGGGSLSEATELTGLFINQGPVVQVRSAQGRVEAEEDSQDGMVWDGPLAVMVNRGSASASEIFAAAIQDYGRGVIIGEPTFGKGTVQMLVDLDNAAQNEKPKYGELKMTSAQFFRINGGTTQLRGVVPDIAFPDGGEAKEFGESSYQNALPWSSITPAKYEAVADLKPILPMLATRHEARAAKSKEWQYYAEDQAEVKRLRAEKTVSLNEAERRKERDDQEARKKARDAERAAIEKSEPSDVTIASATTTAVSEGTTAEDADKPVAQNADDGLQADERSIKSQVEREKQAKQRKDVALEEAAHILADEIGLIRADTKLAQQVLPQAGGKIRVD
jgi:carboxyl-terminal processing protease